GDGDAVTVARLGPGGVRPVRLEVDAVAGGVKRPLAADVGRRGDHRHTRDAESIRWAMCSPKVVLPAAGVAEARNASPEWSKTLAAAACCQARSGRPVGQDGRERPAAGRGGASISYVTGPKTV